MQNLLDDEYLAGLWTRYLPYQLLWIKRQDTPMSTESLEYRAPTWSWASIATRVSLYSIPSDGDGSLAIEVLGSETIPVTADNTGKFIGGYVRLRGWLRAVAWARYPRSCMTRLDFSPHFESFSDKKPFDTPSSIGV